MVWKTLRSINPRASGPAFIFWKYSDGTGSSSRLKLDKSREVSESLVRISNEPFGLGVRLGDGLPALMLDPVRWQVGHGVPGGEPESVTPTTLIERGSAVPVSVELMITSELEVHCPLL